MSESNGTTKKRQLTQARFFKLCQWLSNHQELLVANAPTYKQLAADISKEMEVEIAPYSVARAIEISGVKYAPKGNPIGISGAKKAHMRLNDAESRIARLEADQAVLLGFVRTMARELGCKLDDPLSRLLDVAKTALVK